MQGARRDRGFTIIEVTAAMAVVAVVAAVVIQMMVSSHNAARATAQRRLASGIAQGALERLRSLPPDELVTGSAAKLDLPPEAAALHDASFTATVAPWRGEEGLRHVKVVLGWRSRRGVEREVVREGLASDERTR